MDQKLPTEKQLLTQTIHDLDDSDKSKALAKLQVDWGKATSLPGTGYDQWQHSVEASLVKSGLLPQISELYETKPDGSKPSSLEAAVDVVTSRNDVPDDSLHNFLVEDYLRRHQTIERAEQKKKLQVSVKQTVADASNSDSIKAYADFQRDWLTNTHMSQKDFASWVTQVEAQLKAKGLFSRLSETYANSFGSRPTGDDLTRNEDDNSIMPNNMHNALLQDFFRRHGISEDSHNINQMGPSKSDVFKN